MLKDVRAMLKSGNFFRLFSLSRFKVLKNNKGFTLSEFALVLALVAIILGGLFGYYRYRILPTTYSTALNDKFNSVWSTLQVAQSSRGGAYPLQAGAATFPSSSAVSWIGTGSTDIAAWTYQCTAGGTLTIIINDVNSPSTDTMTQLAAKITNAVPGVTATVNSQTQLTVSIVGVVCS